MSLFKKTFRRLPDQRFFKKNSSLSQSIFKKGDLPKTAVLAVGSNLNLHDVLKNSYASSINQSQFGADKGYVFDKDLSSHNQQVYFHPEQKKLLVSIAGTHNVNDLLTDTRLMTGGLKNTDRYKEADKILQQAKNKYGVNNAVVSGHSLGGSIASAIGSSGDKIITLDKGQTIGNTTRKNEQALRSAGDVVSLLGAKSGIKTIGSGSVLTGGISGALGSHNISNIKNAGIFI